MSSPSEADFPANSSKSKSEPAPKKVEQISLSGSVQPQKPPFGSKFKGVFFGSDARETGSYLFMDVLVPAAKDLILEMVTKGADRALFGERASARRTSSYSSPATRTSYTSYSSNATRSTPGRYSSTPPWEEQRRTPTMSQQAQSSHNFNELKFERRDDATRILDEMLLLIEQYDIASVSDLYGLVGLTGSFTDDKWGWSSLADAKIVPTRGGYLIDLPPTMPLD